MAEATSKVIQNIAPGTSNAVWLFYIKGTTASINDTFTVSGVTTVIGATLVNSAGSVGVLTFATNVITVTSVAATWSGLVWGNP